MIIQLCLAFSLALWYVIQPFMGEYFNLRSRMLLYEYLMGTPTISKSKEHQLKQERQSQRFNQLSFSEQQELKNDYRQLQNYAARSSGQKIRDGMYRLITQIPPFEQAWIFFSIVISLLVLLKKEGAKQSLWLLLLIVCAYAADNQLTGKIHSTSPDEQLFPQESLIIEKYLETPLSPNFFDQKEQLEQGWKHYLLDRWSSPLPDSLWPLEEAEFNFTLARLRLLRNQPFSDWLYFFHEKLSFFSLCCYLLWNGLFAWSLSSQSVLSLLKNFNNNSIKKRRFYAS